MPPPPARDEALQAALQAALDIDRLTHHADDAIADALFAQLTRDRRRLAMAAGALTKHAPQGAKVMWRTDSGRVLLTVGELASAMLGDDTARLRSILTAMRSCHAAMRSCHAELRSCQAECHELHPRALQFVADPPPYGYYYDDDAEELLAAQIYTDCTSQPSRVGRAILENASTRT
jgi:hypothetical protein